MAHIIADRIRECSRAIEREFGRGIVVAWAMADRDGNEAPDDMRDPIGFVVENRTRTLDPFDVATMGGHVCSMGARVMQIARGNAEPTVEELRDAAMMAARTFRDPHSYRTLRQEAPPEGG